MASVTVDLICQVGTRALTRGGIIWFAEFNGNTAPDQARREWRSLGTTLTANGSEAWIRSFTFGDEQVNQGGFINPFKILNFNTVTAFLGSDPIDLTEAWENSGTAITLQHGTKSLVIPGPNNGFWPVRDSSSPYNARDNYSFSNRQTQAYTDFFSDIGAGPGKVITAVFDDGLGPPTVVEADAGGPYRVVSGETVALFGAASVENASGDTTYAWTRKSGSGGRISSTTCLLYTSPSPRDS